MKTMLVAAGMAATLSLTATLAVALPQAGVDAAGIDKSVQPGDDFFRYANGAWYDRTEIPADRSSWGVTGEMRNRTDEQVSTLIKAQATAVAGSEARKVGDFYTAYMDEAAIERAGLNPLKSDLDRIAAIQDKAGLAREFGLELRADVDALNNTDYYTDHVFGLWVEQDLNRPGQYAPYLMQGGLGLPDRDYYLSDSPRMAQIRTAYVAHLTRMLTLAGRPDAAASAQRIFELETKIARTHASRADSDDVQKANNPWVRADFAKKAPGLDWNAFFAAAQLSKPNRFIVWHPSAITGEAALVASEPLSVWKEYLAMRHLTHYASLLPKAFVEENFAFYGRTLSGTPQMQDRWKRAVNATNASMGEAVGKVYVAKYFPPSSKAAVQAMVKDIVAAFDRRIDSLDWMAPSTKAEAKRKLSTLKVGVGYPDKWINYAALNVSPTDALGNTRRAEMFEYQRNLAKLGKPVDRSEWVMTPQTVNAVNLPVKNALNFPAAELMDPNFNPASSIAANYGGIGSIIGHEISHSFDDTGSQFDSKGLLRNWWTDQDLDHFHASSRALAAQYSAYKPFPDLSLNGEQVLGENIADVAGLSASYDAYRKASGGEGASVGGLTGDQQFFLAFAQAWRTKMREAQMRQQVVTDGHAPAQFRAYTVRNLDPWYAAFDVRPGQKLYLAPAQRVRVW